MSKVIGGEAQPPELQADRNLTVFGGFCRLTSCGIQLGLDFIHDVSQPLEILGNTFEFSLSVRRPMVPEDIWDCVL